MVTFADDEAEVEDHEVQENISEVDQWDQCPEEMVHFFDPDTYDKIAEEAVAWVKTRQRLEKLRTGRNAKQTIHSAQLFAKLRMSLRMTDLLNAKRADAPPPEKLSSELRNQLSITERISVHRTRLGRSTEWLSRREEHRYAQAQSNSKHASQSRSRSSTQKSTSSHSYENKPILDAALEESEQDNSSNEESDSSENYSSDECETFTCGYYRNSIDHSHKNTRDRKYRSKNSEARNDPQLGEWLQAVFPFQRYIATSRRIEPFKMGDWLMQRAKQESRSLLRIPPFQKAYIEGLAENEAKSLFSTLTSLVYQLSLRQSCLPSSDILRVMFLNTCPAVLDLSGCELQSDQLQALGGVFKHLRRLDLSCNNLELTHAEILAEYIQLHGQNLTELELSSNNILCQGALLILHAIANLGDKAKILHLGLAANNISTDPNHVPNQPKGSEIIEITQNTLNSLSSENIGSNTVTDNNSNGDLDTTKNMDADLSHTFVQSLSARECPTLRHVDLAGNELDFAVATQLVELVHPVGHLYGLHMNCNKDFHVNLSIYGHLQCISGADPYQCLQGHQQSLLDRPEPLTSRITVTSSRTICLSCGGWQRYSFRYGNVPAPFGLRQSVLLNFVGYPNPIRMENISSQGWIATVFLQPGEHRYYFSTPDAPSQILLNPGLPSVRYNGILLHQIILEPRELSFDPEEVIDIEEEHLPFAAIRADDLKREEDRRNDIQKDYELLCSCDAIKGHFAEVLLHPPISVSELDLKLEWDFPGSYDTVANLKKSFEALHAHLCSTRMLLHVDLAEEYVSGIEFLQKLCNRAIKHYNKCVEQYEGAVDPKSLSLAHSLNEVFFKEIVPGMRFDYLNPLPLRDCLYNNASFRHWLCMYNDELRTIFHRIQDYGGSQQHQTKEVCSFSRWMHFLGSQRIYPLLVGQRQARIVFFQSLRSKPLYDRSQVQSWSLEWIEFIEAICRLASAAWIPGPALRSLLGIKDPYRDDSYIDALRCAIQVEHLLDDKVQISDLFRAEPDLDVTPAARIRFIVQALTMDIKQSVSVVIKTTSPSQKEYRNQRVDTLIRNSSSTVGAAEACLYAVQLIHSEGYHNTNL